MVVRNRSGERTIAAATGKQPYVVGKPNSLMMIYARRMLGASADGTKRSRSTGLVT